MMDWKGKKVLVLGDSITEGAAASAWANVYHQRLSEMLGFSELIAYGKGGTRIARQKTPSENPLYDHDFNERADAMDPVADLVIAFGGTNDFGHGDAPMGKPGDNTVYTFFGACRCLYKKLAARYGKEKILILTPLHRLKEESAFGDGCKVVPGEPMYRYVEAIKKTAGDMGLKTLDLWADDDLNMFVGDHAKYFSPDGLHPNDEGHRLLAEKIAEYLLRL